MKKIDVIVTDMRASVWDQIPQKDHKQVDVEMKEIPIYGLKAFAAFQLMVRLKFQIKNNSNFVISRPDQDVTLDSLNISKLNDGDRLIILDSKEQQVPFTYRQVMNTIPHTKTITDQDGTYYGNKDQNAAAFAIAELVDNALSATAHNDGNRIIEVRFHENGDKSSLLILDNGCGMNSDVLKSGLIFKAPKDVRRIAAKNLISHFFSQTVF